MEENKSLTVSIGEWIGSLLLLIPIANIVLSAIFWAVTTFLLGWKLQIPAFAF